MKKHKRGIPQFLFSDPMVMSIEGDPAPAGGGDPAPPAGDPAPTFTQEDVNRMVANERRSTAAQLATLQTSADKVAGLETTVQEMKDAKELADASTAEQAQILAQRASDQHQAKLDEYATKITALEADKAAGVTALSDFQTRTTIAQELAKAGMLGAAAKHAVPAMIADSEVTLSEDGSIATIKLDGIMQADLQTAVGQFLVDNPHFKAAPPGGSGSGGPNSGTGTGGKPISEMSQQERWDSEQQR